MAFHNAKDPIRREAFMLKQFSSLNEWRGSLIHRAIEKYFVPSLKQAQLISENEFIRQTIALGKRQLEFSKQQKYKEPNFKKKDAGDSFLALREQKEDIDSFYETIIQCCKYLYSQTRFLAFLQNCHRYSAEKRIQFKFNGTTLIGQLDLVLEYSDKKLCIIDWKTNRNQNSDYSKQLYFYAFAALNNWKNYNADDLLLVEANLLQGKLIKHRVSEKELLEIEDFIYRSTSDIQAVTRNQKYKIEDLENYKYANSSLSCEYCKMEKLCVRLAS